MIKLAKQDAFWSAPFFEGIFEWDPLLDQIQIFEDFTLLNIARHPVKRVRRTDDVIELKFDVPGCAKEDLKVSYLDDILEVLQTTEKKDEQGLPTSNYAYKVRVSNLNVESLEATCSNGVLTVTARELTAEDNKIHIEVK